MDDEEDERTRVRNEFASAQSNRPTACWIGVVEVREGPDWVMIRQDRLEEMRSWKGGSERKQRVQRSWLLLQAGLASPSA